MASKQNKILVMFVCLGNICRSPMAEAVFQKLVNDDGLAERFDVRSSGTGHWHVGERPHSGTLDVLRRNDVPVKPEKRGQQLNLRDVQETHYIIAMDESNKRAIKRTYGIDVPCLLSFAPPGTPLNVPDPYYENNFDEVYALVRKGCEGLLAFIKQQEDL